MKKIPLKLLAKDVVGRTTLNRS